MYLSIYLLYLPVCLSMSVYLSILSIIYLYIYLSVYLIYHLSIYLSLCLSSDRQNTNQRSTCLLSLSLTGEVHELFGVVMLNILDPINGDLASYPIYSSFTIYCSCSDVLGLGVCVGVCVCVCVCGCVCGCVCVGGCVWVCVCGCVREQDRVILSHWEPIFSSNSIIVSTVMF